MNKTLLAGFVFMKKHIFLAGTCLIVAGCGAPDSHVGDEISCNFDGMGGGFVDYYKEYENQDWSGEKDTKYNITINHKVTLTYPAKYKYPDGTEVDTNLVRQGKEDIVGTFEKTAIVPYTKSGSKFIPDFSQHWSVIQTDDAPELVKVIFAADMNSDLDFLGKKSECVIEKIVEKK